MFNYIHDGSHVLYTLIGRYVQLNVLSKVCASFKVICLVYSYENRLFEYDYGDKIRLYVFVPFEPTAFSKLDITTF